MDLVKRKDALSAIDGIETGGLEGGTVAKALCFASVKSRSMVPTIEAVPLEPLCEWLAEYAAPPIRSPHALYGSLKGAWMAYLRKWMQEQEGKHGTD